MIDAYGSNHLDSVAVATVEKRYGKIQRDKGYKYAGTWNTEKVIITYWQSLHKPKRYGFLLRFSYKPMLESIEEIGQKERNNLF